MKFLNRNSLRSYKDGENCKSEVNADNEGALFNLLTNLFYTIMQLGNVDHMTYIIKKSLSAASLLEFEKLKKEGKPIEGELKDIQERNLMGGTLYAKKNIKKE